MKKKAVKKEGRIPNSAKITFAVILIIVSIVYCWYTFGKYSRGLNTRDEPAIGRNNDRPDGQDGRRGGPPGDRQPPSEEERQARRQEMMNELASELELTEEQKTQMTAAMSSEMPQSREGWQQRREQMAAILTPEQQEKAREVMRNRFGGRGGPGGPGGRMRERMETAERVLPPDQMEILEERLEQRIQDFRDRRGSRNNPPDAPPGESPPDRP
jgi:Spy/CpxP family protein refolding chaperone